MDVCRDVGRLAVWPSQPGGYIVAFGQLHVMPYRVHAVIIGRAAPKVNIILKIIYPQSYELLRNRS
jgi:hypothetical protein